MASLSAPGIGSGLDVNGIVSQLMELEQQPLVALQKRQSEFQAQLSALGQLKSAVSTFNDAMEGLSSVEKFKVFSASSGDEGVFTVDASSNAGGGTFNIQVNNLAERQKLASGPFAGGADGEVGTGTLSFTVNGESFDVLIDGDNDSLTQIRDAINNSAENTGVVASIINESGGSRLIFTAENTGLANTIDVSVSNATGDLGQLASANLTEIQGAADASITIDNQFTVSSASNSVSDVIEGVTINLESVGSAELNITRDNEAIGESVQAFADAYNNLRNALGSLGQGALSGDSTLRSVANQLRDVINTPASGLASGYSNLTEIGVSLQKDGSMSVDSEKLQSALDDNLAGVASLFSNESEGFAVRFQSLADSLLDTDGVLETREDGINDRLKGLQNREDQLDRRLISVEEGLRSRFSALDSLLAQLQSTSTFLTGQLASLPKAGG
ncbi:MAG: flagellar filament capping protein FliD [Chromatiales bacterium]|nr:flagellar filament capping protein FliD [Chromatiales bacterium]